MPTIEELAKKSPKYCWSKVNYMWHYLGLYVARPLLTTNITPNQITVSWIFLQLLAVMFMLGSYWYRVVGILIVNVLVNLLDYTDGNVARIKNIKTSLGEYLDRVGIYTGMPLILLALGIGKYVKENDVISFYAGIICCIALLYDKLFNVNPAWYEPEKWGSLKQVYLKSSLCQKDKNWFSTLSEIFRKTQPLNLLFFGIVFDYLRPYSVSPLRITLIIYAIITTLAMVKKLYQQMRELQRIDHHVSTNKGSPEVYE